MEYPKAACCNFRRIKAGQAWGDYRKKVRQFSRHQRLTAEQAAELAKLKEQATKERESFHEHLADETLEHQ